MKCTGKARITGKKVGISRKCLGERKCSTAWETAVWDSFQHLGSKVCSEVGWKRVLQQPRVPASLGSQVSRRGWSRSAGTATIHRRGRSRSARADFASAADWPGLTKGTPDAAIVSFQGSFRGCACRKCSD